MNKVQPLFFLLFLLFISLSLKASKCKDLEYSYVLGDYQECLNYSTQNDDRCEYIKALCEIAATKIDKARYRLSKISTTVKNNKINFYNAMALNSLVEIAFTLGNYNKANKLAPETNGLISRDIPDSYPYIVSELILIKSMYDSKYILPAFRRIEMLKSINADKRIFDSLNTEIK